MLIDVNKGSFLMAKVSAASIKFAIIEYAEYQTTVWSTLHHKPLIQNFSKVPWTILIDNKITTQFSRY